MEKLPCDLIDEIADHLDLQKQHILFLTKSNICSDNKSKQIIDNLNICSLRITLFLKLRLHICKFFLVLNKCLRSYSRYFNTCEYISRYNQNCMLYSPVYPYGTCRFCGRHMATHRYRKMVDIYLNLS